MEKKTPGFRRGDMVVSPSLYPVLFLSSSSAHVIPVRSCHPRESGDLFHFLPLKALSLFIKRDLWRATALSFMIPRL